MSEQTVKYTDPKTWGPRLWFILHLGSRYYDENPNPTKQTRMINFIKGIPSILPCETCCEHCNYFVTNNPYLPEIVKTRVSLFNFFVDMHNYVNKRHGKRIFSYEEAWNMYSDTIDRILTEPRIWGPSFWFVIHVGTRYYDENPLPYKKQQMKGFILGLSVILPCQECIDHSTAFILKRWGQIDKIVSDRRLLFNFFVDMHNAVNKRYGKPELTYEEAWKRY